MKDKVLHITIDENLKKQLKEEALQRGISLNAYIKLIIYERGK